MPLALGVETSCDDCSVSVVKDDGEVLFLSKGDQTQDHAPFGGVVPELASRRHEDQLLYLIEKALKHIPLSQIDLIAVTNRPGLLGSLLVGCVTAKTLSLAWNKPIIGVNHIEAHIFSPFLFSKYQTKPKDIQFPSLAFVVSGGHTSLFYVENIGKSLLIAKTRDDSAGEAFDKFARGLGLPFPGGPHIDRLSRQAVGSRKRKNSFFTKIKTKDISFSFSGLKSQAQRFLSEKPENWIKTNRTIICADYEKVIVDHLMDKLEKAFKKRSFKSVLVGGGVSSNYLFRERLKDWCKSVSTPCLFPEKIFCEDNGAMIAFTGLKYFLKGHRDHFEMSCSPRHLDRDFFKDEDSFYE